MCVVCVCVCVRACMRACVYNREREGKDKSERLTSRGETGVNQEDICDEIHERLRQINAPVLCTPDLWVKTLAY